MASKPRRHGEKCIIEYENRVGTIASMSLFSYEENGQRDNIKPSRWEIKMMTTKKKPGNPYLFRMIPWALFPNAVGFLFSVMFGDNLAVCRMSQLLTFFLWLLLLRGLRKRSQISGQDFIKSQILSLVIALLVNEILVFMPLEIIAAGRSISWDFPFAELATFAGSKFPLIALWLATFIVDLFFVDFHVKSLQ